jgi:hypothetical protein
MRRSAFITTAAAITIAGFSARRVFAQQADISFISDNTSSYLHIAQAAVGYNGTITPIPFNPVTGENPKLKGISFIITSLPIPISAYRSLNIDLRDSIIVDGTKPLFGSQIPYAMVGTRVEVLDAESNTVLKEEFGLHTSFKSTKLADTTTAQHISIDLSDIQAKNIILRFSGTNMMEYLAPARIVFNNDSNISTYQVH